MKNQRKSAARIRRARVTSTPMPALAPVVRGEGFSSIGVGERDGVPGVVFTPPVDA